MFDWFGDVIEAGENLLNKSIELGERFSDFAQSQAERLYNETIELLERAHILREEEEIAEEAELENEDEDEAQEEITETDADTSSYYEDILLEIEEAQKRADEYLASEDVAEIEEEPDYYFPDDIDEDTIQDIFNDLGIVNWHDLTDEEKEYYHPEPDEVDDIESIERNGLIEDLGIDPDIASEMSTDELLAIAQMYDDRIGIAREFLGDDFNPNAAAEELDATFRGSFDSWEDLINSKQYNFLLESGLIFLDIYTDDDGIFHIDVYERDT